MKTTDIVIFLKTIPLFADADPALLKEMLEGPHTHVISLSAQESFDERFSHALGIVLKGQVQIRSADAEKRLVLRTVGTGEVFGAASLFLPQSPPPSHLVALHDCTVLFCEHEAVRALLGKDPRFLDAYLGFLADRVQFLNRKIRCFTAGSAERRLALWLCEQAANGTVTIHSFSTLAALLDMGRASLYRALDKLENDGLILHNGREIQILCADDLLQKYHS
ncbi:MAG: Crp/Fnr family transcriptional regulator [Ruminococcaceae bacterium]|nr:Crp/Fnr family transcriptional regulator [Oscillospiraceae bacterium]